MNPPADIRVEASAELSENRLTIKYTVTNISKGALLIFDDRMIESRRTNPTKVLHSSRAIVVYNGQQNQWHLILGYNRPNGSHETAMAHFSSALQQLAPFQAFSGEINLAIDAQCISEWNPNSAIQLNRSPSRTGPLPDNIYLTCMYAVPDSNVSQYSESVAHHDGSGSTQVSFFRISPPNSPTLKAQTILIRVPISSAPG